MEITDFMLIIVKVNTDWQINVVCKVFGADFVVEFFEFRGTHDHKIKW